MNYNRSFFLNNKTSFCNKRTLHEKEESSNGLPSKLLTIQSILFNRIIIPLMKDKCDEVIKNSYILQLLKKDLQKYQSKYNINYLMELITLLETIIYYLEDYKIYINNENEKYNYLNVCNCVIKVSRIRMLSQYEIYKLIYPNCTKYETDILEYIKELMMNYNIDFENIKQTVINKFP